MNIVILYSTGNNDDYTSIIFYYYCVSVIESPHGGGIGDLSGQLSDLSIASGSSSLLTAGSGVGADGGDREGTKRHEEASYRAHCCRSCKSLPEYVSPSLPVSLVVTACTDNYIDFLYFSH